MQAIYNIAEICSKHGIEDAILSPGSRCAPLSIAFANHPSIQCKSIIDERSAAFIAMGIAQQKNKAVVLICTSGTAALNYYPAIAEAFYQGIPLIILTADRPAEWIDQQDGQAIRQNNLYSNHIKKSWTLPSEYNFKESSWHIERVVSEAILTAEDMLKGPVHINCPFREPFYPTENQEITFSETKIIRKLKTTSILEDTSELQGEINEYSKILIVAGQQRKSNELNSILNKTPYPIISDTIANISTENSIKHHDLFLGALLEEDKLDLQPDLIISFGQSIVSKNVKLFLRKFKAKRHIHLGPSNHISDSFQCLTDVIPIDPHSFFSFIETRQTNDYAKVWKRHDKNTTKLLANFFEGKSFSEFESIKILLESVSTSNVLHIANSMPIRYVNFLQTKAEVFANRGTSGIDGSLSTAIGAALANNKKTHFCILGDLSFFYDRNALWNSYVPNNLKIIVLNNQGGGIFRMINGPRKRKELEQIFVTEQKQTAEATAKDHQLNYWEASNKSELDDKLKLFIDCKEKALLEIHTNGLENTKALDDFKLLLKEKI